MKKIVASLLLITGPAVAMKRPIDGTEAGRKRVAVAQIAVPTVQVRCSDGVVLTIPKNILQGSRVLRGCLEADSQESELIPLEHVDAATMQRISTVLQKLCDLVQDHERGAVVRHLLSKSAPLELENIARCADYLDIPELHNVALDLLFEHADTPKAFLDRHLGNVEISGYQEPFLASKAGKRLGYSENWVLPFNMNQLPVAWSPDGKQLIVGYINGAAWILDSASRQWTRLLQHGAPGRGCLVISVAWSPDGTKVITGSNEDTAKIWDVATGQCLHIVRSGGFPGSSNVSSVAWSPDGTKVITGAQNGAAKIWDVATGNCIHTLQHTGTVISVAWSPDGTKVLTGSYDKTAKIWDVATGQCVHILQHNDLVISGAWSPDGTKVITGSCDRTARIWHVPTGNCVRTLKHKSGVYSVAWSPDGLQVLTAEDQTVRVWDLARGGTTIAHVFEEKGDRSHVSLAQWSNDGKQIRTNVSGYLMVRERGLPRAEELSYKQTLFLVWALSFGTKNIVIAGRARDCFDTLPDEVKQALAARGFMFKI